MATNPYSQPGAPHSDKPNQDFERARERGSEEFASAKEEARKAGDRVREAGADFTRRAQETAYEQGNRGKEQVAGGLDDFAAAVRKASDELGSRDQSMASSLVREVAGGLEQASRTIHGKDVGELTRSVARFARERPATFLAGVALAGLALGRFAQSTSERDERDYYDEDDRFRSSGRGRSYGRERSSDERYSGYSTAAGGTGGSSEYRSSYRDQPIPTEGAAPVGREGLARSATSGQTSEVSRAAVTDPLAPRPSTSTTTGSTYNDMPKGGSDER